MKTYYYLQDAKTLHKAQKQSGVKSQTDSSEKIDARFTHLVLELKSYLTNQKQILDTASIDNTELLTKHGDKIVAKINDTAQAIEPICQDLNPEEHLIYKAYFQKHLLELVTMSSAFSKRAYLKPNGYAGDYIMMNMLCRDSIYVGETLFEKCSHRFSVTSPSGSLVKSRQKLIYQIIAEVVAQKANARILDLACGPSLYLQNFLQKQNQSHLELFFLDQDTDAINSLKDDLGKIKENNSSDAKLHFYNQTFQTLFSDTNALEKLAHQNLIISSGLFDYLNDDQAQMLVQALYSLLAPNGILLIGNISPQLTTKIFQWYVNEWPLNYRNEEQLKALAPQEIQFDVIAEELGFNLFLKIQKTTNSAS